MFTTALLIVVAIGFVFGGLLLLNKRAFDRVFHLGKSQAGKLGRAAEQADPIAQMREAADEAKDQVVAARDALIKSKALKDSLARQVNTNKAEVARAKAKLDQYKQEGRKKDDPEVVKAAEKLAKAMSSLATNEKQLEIQMKLYKTTLASAKSATDKISELNRDADNLEVRLETSNAQAELAESLSSFNPSGVSSVVSKASRYAEIAEQKIAANNAKLEVNADLGLATDSDEDLEVSLAASAILDDFEK